MLWQVTFLILAFIVGAQYGHVRVQASEQAASTATEQLERLRDSLQAMQAQQATARRDHMAMAAMQGLLASERPAMFHPDIAAAHAYAYADALLKAGGHHDA